MLNKEQIKTAFMNIQLEENYNFLEEDLVMLANAFVEAAKPMIIRSERAQCVKIARAINVLVAEKILEERAKS